MSNCGCIGIYRATRLDESYREILKMYQQIVKEDTCWFSIELEWHLKPTYTNSEKQQLAKVFNQFPEQVIWIFGESDRIFVAAHEIIKHFGGLLQVKTSHNRDYINSYPGVKIEIQKKNYKDPLKYKPDYWLVDHIFIRTYYTSFSKFTRFKLDSFLPSAYSI
ncbi:MAG: hypothetical protein NTZ85_02265 [Bacteroidia bacterium]|nr:hypothetical protein [Bacteroidia bacterium]